jgi:hypothetical protein
MLLPELQSNRILCLQRSFDSRAPPEVKMQFDDSNVISVLINLFGKAIIAPVCVCDGLSTVCFNSKWIDQSSDVQC